MDSPVQQPGQQPLGQLACTACGKRFRYKSDLAGKTVTCPCGARITTMATLAASKTALAYQGFIGKGPALPYLNAT